jgi:hypothetical protein
MTLASCDRGASEMSPYRSIGVQMKVFDLAEYYVHRLKLKGITEEHVKELADRIWFICEEYRKELESKI